MTIAAKRQELKNYIDAMADDNISAVEPILSLLANMNVRSMQNGYAVETDLNDEERKIIRLGMEEYKEHPERFIKLEDVNWGDI